MRLRNIGKLTVEVAGLAISPTREGEVEAADYQRWLGRSAANRHIASVSLRILPTKGNPFEALLRDCKRRPERHKMTLAGEPSCLYLTKTLGRMVGAVERDRAWWRVVLNNSVKAA